MSPTTFGATTVLTTLDEIADPKHTALLLYDALHHSLDRISQRDTGLVPRWARLLEAARARGVSTVYTRHRRDPTFVSGAWLRYRMRLHGVDDPARLPEFQVSDPDAYEVVEALQPRDGEPVMDKYLNSAFAGTPLDLWLRSRRLTTIVLTGVATESGIETTCRQALLAGYYVVVPSDCVASSDDELHQASLRYMARCAEVTTAEALIASWNAQPA